MTTIKFIRFAVTTFSLIFVLSSCGGGGDNNSKTDTDNTKETGGGEVIPEVSKTTPVVITEDNAPYIAHLAFKLGFRLAKLPSDFEAPAGIKSAAKFSQFSEFETVNDNSERINYSLTDDFGLLAAVLSCPGGGTLSHPEPASFIGTYSYDTCIHNGITTTGSYVISGIGNKGNFKGSVKYNSYSKTSTLNGTTKTNGSYDLLIISDTTESDFTIISTVFTFSNSFDTSDMVDIRVNNYKNAELNYARVRLAYTLNNKSTRLKGSLTVSTVTPFYILLDNPSSLPFSGEGVVRGADNARVKLTVLGGQLSDNVKIEIDLDGNGYNPNLERMITWQDLLNI